VTALDPMTEAAAALLAQLDPELRARTQHVFGDDATRRDWHYAPRARPGPSLDELDRPARKAVHLLLVSALRFPAYAQVAAIMALEDVLDQLEGGGRRRHRDDYQVMVFGEPGADAWGWRFEGHHVSVNLPVVDGQVAATPLFLGANPAVIPGALRPLAGEEELARALLAALDGPALGQAVVSDEAPSDITTRAATAVDPPEPLGVARTDLHGPAADALDRLLRLYLDRLAVPALQPPADLTFAWSGPVDRGQPHYYRLAGQGLLVEYDNTQNGANHIHTVCRHPARDFGQDLLAVHYAERH
jgi:Protein of unknown function (DUF3500)